MSNLHEPQLDEPFDHDVVLRHTHSGSSANLLQGESSSRPSESESYTLNDGFYDDPAQNKSNVYDKPEPDYLYDPTSRQKTTNYQDLGLHVSTNLLLFDSEGTRSVEYEDDGLYDEARARPLREKASPLSRFLATMGNDRNSLQQRIDAKKRGIGRQKYPFVGA